MILHEIETADGSTMAELQLERLKKTLDHVYRNVQFYQKKLNELMISPDKISSLQDIQHLPFTTKKDLRDNYPFGLFAVPRNDIVRLHASSGTSGKPTVVAYTQKDIDMWSDIVARSIAIGGGEKGELLHNAYGYGLFTGGLGLHYGSERLGMLTVPVSGGNTQRQIQLIEDFKPSVICGTPSYLLAIAEKMEQLGKNPAETSLKYGIFGAEPWSEEMRITLESKWNIKACDIYGLSEVIGPGVAMECHEAQDGLHIAEDHFYTEIIDPVSLKVLPMGEEGELVFTSLTKEAIPIIRYRTGDIASIIKERCECGRTTLKMSRVKGRVDDMLIIRGVNVFPSEIEHHLLTIPELSPHYQLLLSKENNLDCLKVRVEIKQTDYDSLEDHEYKANSMFLSRKIEEVMKTGCYVSVHAEVVPPGTIPRSEGKAVRLVDNRVSVK
ncbi:AMP-binding protein [Bacillus tianshenii]|uniref:phenylacetate--CoA ligase family protein n=1 Tax=Sutcliffiella tianshenii TaxID=1463404 RepID=UPI001CD4406C|nr:AMP-binding protein [Bacillus tianshenii]MCA1321077.1 AMP-binding protein [Bacillus tianshenii]